MTPATRPDDREVSWIERRKAARDAFEATEIDIAWARANCEGHPDCHDPLLILDVLDWYPGESSLLRGSGLDHVAMNRAANARSE